MAGYSKNTYIFMTLLVIVRSAVLPFMDSAKDARTIRGMIRVSSLSGILIVLLFCG
jgi:hypothetical protein